ncbi:hypothetical protein FIBSPDRAFT_865032, partial [Athelia psychrophila]
RQRKPDVNHSLTHGFESYCFPGQEHPGQRESHSAPACARPAARAPQVRLSATETSRHDPARI